MVQLSGFDSSSSSRLVGFIVSILQAVLVAQIGFSQKKLVNRTQHVGYLQPEFRWAPSFRIATYLSRLH